MEDAEVVATQIERSLRAAVDVSVRCHLDLPVVIDVPPLLDDGTPFPTRYWLSCPLAVKRIAQIESDGGVREAEQWLAEAPERAGRMQAAHDRYARGRDALVPVDHPGPRPGGGVAGIPAGSPGVKCLHAHYADSATGNDNPVGEKVASKIEPLDCSVPCVIDGGEGGVVANPNWFAPPK